MLNLIKLQLSVSRFEAISQLLFAMDIYEFQRSIEFFMPMLPFNGNGVHRYLIKTCQVFYYVFGGAKQTCNLSHVVIIAVWRNCF